MVYGMEHLLLPQDFDWGPNVENKKTYYWVLFSFCMTKYPSTIMNDTVIIWTRKLMMDWLIQKKQVVIDRTQLQKVTYLTYKYRKIQPKYT